jgi:hypothetical protein
MLVLAAGDADAACNLTTLTDPGRSYHGIVANGHMVSDHHSAVAEDCPKTNIHVQRAAVKRETVKTTPQQNAKEPRDQGDRVGPKSEQYFGGRAQSPLNPAGRSKGQREQLAQPVK